LPEDPDELTEERLTEAFNHLKKFQIDKEIYCRHEVPQEVEFLLASCGKNYKAKKIVNGKV